MAHRTARLSAVLVVATATATVAPDAPEMPFGPGDAHGARPAGVHTRSARITDLEAIEPAMAAAINSLRRRHGLRSLSIAAPLAQAGDGHARALALAGRFTHDWPDGRPLVRWMPGFYRPQANRRWMVGENLLWSAGPISPDRAVGLWLRSPSHRRVILSSLWRDLGVGVIRAEGAGGVYGGQDVYVVAAEFGLRD